MPLFFRVFFGTATIALLTVFSLNAHSIVFIHIGPSFPDHLPFSIAQARLFNKECPIYLIANRATINKGCTQFAEYRITPIACESLPLSRARTKFSNNSRNHDYSTNGLWYYSLLRFFYLDDFVRAANLSDVFHLENDMMLYTDLSDLLPIFKKYYKGMIGATFETDALCVPGFIYISGSEPLEQLIQTFPDRASSHFTDMTILSLFKDNHRNVFIDSLPTLPPEYIENHQTTLFKDSKNCRLFCNRFEAFSSVFDGAAFGVYLGGWDPKYFKDQDTEPGVVSKYCMYNVSYFTYDWEVDSEGRRIPFITYKGHRIKINNLHLSNKVRLPTFHSLYKS